MFPVAVFILAEDIVGCLEGCRVGADERKMLIKDAVFIACVVKCFANGFTLLIERSEGFDVCAIYGVTFKVCTILIFCVGILVAHTKRWFSDVGLAKYCEGFWVCTIHVASFIIDGIFVFYIVGIGDYLKRSGVYFGERMQYGMQGVWNNFANIHLHTVFIIHFIIERLFFWRNASEGLCVASKHLCSIHKYLFTNNYRIRVDIARRSIGDICNFLQYKRITIVVYGMQFRWCLYECV